MVVEAEGEEIGSGGQRGCEEIGGGLWSLASGQWISLGFGR